MSLPAELSHDLTLKLLQWSGGFPFNGHHNDFDYPVECMGLTFKNPVGLAAGLDKNGYCLSALSRLGFGFIEVGTVTPKPQSGNAKPRLFRLPKHQAMINRMGFNNEGVDALVERLKHRNKQCLLGVNIGKNKLTPNQQAKDDYQICYNKVYPYADYIVVNLSSPNTPGLRELQESAFLTKLLETLKEEQHRLSVIHQRRVPLVLKIAPDLSPEAIEEIAHTALKFEVDGLIATNTTIQRPGLEEVSLAKEAGGLSGAPLTPIALQTLQLLQQTLKGQIPLVGVGGIMTVEDARYRLQSGAQLIQLYSGFIYQGPALIKEIVTSLQHDSLSCTVTSPV